MLACMASTVLVIEDDDGIAAPLVRTLEREGYDVERFASGRPGVDRALDGGVDVMILDLGLPDMDGLDVCRQVRDAGHAMPILILTARGGELDRVVGLDVGADDYMSKPFGLAELLARIRALLRRNPTGPGDAEAATLTPVEGLRVDVARRQVWADGQEVALTSKEFDVLALLCNDRGSVVTRERLMDEVWDANWYGSTKTLDVTVGRLRQKLEDSSSPSRVVTVRGVGFRLEDGPVDA